MVYECLVPKCVIQRINEPGFTRNSMKSKRFEGAVLFPDVSGFTRLSEKFAAEEEAGAEKLSIVMNSYFAVMLNLIFEYNGDVIKFAGDALQVVWSFDLPGAIVDISLVAHCGWNLVRQLDNHDTGFDHILRLKATLGSGILVGMHVGADDRWEYCVAGEPLLDIAVVEHDASPGDFVVSRDSWDAGLQSSGFTGSPLPSGGMKITGFIEVQSLSLDLMGTFKQFSGAASGTDATIDPGSSLAIEAVSAYMNGYFVNRLQSHLGGSVSESDVVETNKGSFGGGGGTDQGMEPMRMEAALQHTSELRRVTILFATLPELKAHLVPLESFQGLVAPLFKHVQKHAGQIRQFIVDDKGVVLIAVFGLPPLVHEDDAARAVKTGLAMVKTATAQGHCLGVGVTCGQAFVGGVGSGTRFEYAVMGDVVNMSARLSCKARGEVLVSEEVGEQAKEVIELEDRPPAQMKGKLNPVTIHRAVSVRRGMKTSNSFTKPRDTSLALCGREQALVQLREALDRFHAGSEGSLVALHSAAGMGGSRMLEEAAGLCKQSDLVVLRCTALLAEKQTPYFSLRPAMRAQAMALLRATRPIHRTGSGDEHGNSNLGTEAMGSSCASEDLDRDRDLDPSLPPSRYHSTRSAVLEVDATYSIHSAFSPADACSPRTGGNTSPLTGGRRARVPRTSTIIPIEVLERLGLGSDLMGSGMVSVRNVPISSPPPLRGPPRASTAASSAAAAAAASTGLDGVHEHSSSREEEKDGSSGISPLPNRPWKFLGRRGRGGSGPRMYHIVVTKSIMGRFLGRKRQARSSSRSISTIVDARGLNPEQDTNSPVVTSTPIVPFAHVDESPHSSPHLPSNPTLGRKVGRSIPRLSRTMSSQRLIPPAAEAAVPQAKQRRVSLMSQGQVAATVTGLEAGAGAGGGEKSTSSACHILDEFVAGIKNPHLARASFWSCLDRLLELPPVELVTLLPLLKSYLKLPGLTDSKVAADLQPAALRPVQRLITMLLLLLQLRRAEGGVEGGEGESNKPPSRNRSFGGRLRGDTASEGVPGPGDDVRNGRFRTSHSIVESAASPVFPPRKSRRLVVLVDDAHYLDGESLRLLSLLLRSPSWPILVVMVSQTLELPHFSSLRSSAGHRGAGTAPAPPLSGVAQALPFGVRHTHVRPHPHAHPITSVVELGPLSPSDVVDLSCAALKVSSIPPSITDYIYDKARGSPMYTLEFVAAIKRADLLVMEGEGQPCELNSDALLVHDESDPDPSSGSPGISSILPKKIRTRRRRKRSSVASTVSSVSSVSTASTALTTVTASSSCGSTTAGGIYPTVLFERSPPTSERVVGADTDMAAAVAAADAAASDRADVPRSPSDRSPSTYLEPPPSAMAAAVAPPASSSSSSSSSAGLTLSMPSISVRVAHRVLSAVTLLSSTPAPGGGQRLRRRGRTPHRNSLPSLPSIRNFSSDWDAGSARDADGEGQEGGEGREETENSIGDGDRASLPQAPSALPPSPSLDSPNSSISSMMITPVASSSASSSSSSAGLTRSAPSISVRVAHRVLRAVTLLSSASPTIRPFAPERDRASGRYADGDGNGEDQEGVKGGEEKGSGIGGRRRSRRFSGARLSDRLQAMIRAGSGRLSALGTKDKENEIENDWASVGSYTEYSDVGGLSQPGVFGTKGGILDNFKPRRLRRLIDAALQRVVVDMSGRGVVMSRVGLLESEAPELMWLLKVASVIGLSTNCAMWQDVVGRYAQWKGCEEERVGSFLEEWQKHRTSMCWSQLMYVSLPEGSQQDVGDNARYLQDTSFYFRNEFVRQAFYNLMLPSHQMVLHAAVAQLLEAQPLKALSSQLPQLAHHWREAGRPDGVLLYCSEAGRLAQLNHRHEEALSWWTQGLEVCEEGGVTGATVRAAALIGLAEAGALGGEWQAALCRVSQALELLEAGDLVSLVQAEQQQQQQQEEPERNPERSGGKLGGSVARAGTGAVVGAGTGIGGKNKQFQPKQLHRLAQKALAGVLPPPQGGEDGVSLRARMSGVLGDLAGCGWWGRGENNTLPDAREGGVELGGGVEVKTVMPTLRSLILARALLLLAQILTSAALNDDLAVYAALRACLIAYGVGGGGEGVPNPSTKGSSQDDPHPPPSFLAMRHLQLECGLVVGTLLASRPHLFGTRLSAQSARLLTHIFEMSIDLPQLTLASPHNAGPASVLDGLKLGRGAELEPVTETDPAQLGGNPGSDRVSGGNSRIRSPSLVVVSSPAAPKRRANQKPGLKSDLGLTLMRGRPVGLATVMLEMGGLAVAKGDWDDALSFLWCAHDCALEEHLPVTSREVLAVAAFVFWLNGEMGESLYVLEKLQKELSEALNGEEEPGDGSGCVKSDEASTESPSTTSKAPGLPFYSEMALLWAVLSMRPNSNSTLFDAARAPVPPTGRSVRLAEDNSSASVNIILSEPEVDPRLVPPTPAQALTPPRSIKSDMGGMKHKSRSWGPSLIRGSGRKLYVHSHPSAQVAEGGNGSSASPRGMSAPAPPPASPATTPDSAFLLSTTTPPNLVTSVCDVGASFTGSLNSRLASHPSISVANASEAPASIDASESEVLGSRTGGREYAPMRGLDASTYVLGAVWDHVHRCAAFSSSRRDPARLQARHRSKSMGSSNTQGGFKVERWGSGSRRRGGSRGGGSDSGSGRGRVRQRQVSATSPSSSAARSPPRSPTREPGVSVEEDDAGRLQLQRGVDAAEAGLKAMWGRRDLFLFYAWAHLGQAVLMLWETRPEEIKWTPRLDRIMERLRSLARLLPVAQPRLLILEGWRKVVMGSRAEGVRQLRRALKTARKLGMPVEEELARERLLHPDGV